MKIFNLISWLTIIAGIVFKFLHYPGSSLMLIIGNLFLLVHSIIFLISNFKTKGIDSILHLNFTFWSIYLLFRIQYWSGGPEVILGFRLIFIIPLILTLTYLIIRIVNNLKFKAGQILLILFFTFFTIIGSTPAHKIFYIVNLNELLNAESRDWNYFGWDKYSWFLYLSNEKTEALKANKKSEAACELWLKYNPNEEVEEYYNRVQQHKFQILTNTWVDYPRPN